MITSEEIKRRLWDGATDLRGSMDASRYKDYMLGLMFYKFLSDKTLETFKITAGVEKSTEKELVEEYVKAKKEYGEELEKMIQNVLGYFVSPEYLYQIWLKDISDGSFEVEKVADSLNNFERSIVGTSEANDFKGLFSSSTLDLSDTALGSNLHERSKNIKSLILLFADLNMVDLQKGDILGDAYEYLIGQFAMESGKKAGEFYTPHQVSEVMAQIVAKTTTIKSIYDPTVGSGSLLLTVKKHLGKDEQKDLSYYGQEKNTATYNLTRMNLLLHGVRPEKMTIKNGDTLSNDWPEDPENPNDGVQFDAVVMNPPYSVKNWNKAELKVSDPRFEIAGALPPDSKGDYAFLLHGLYHLGIKGTMGIVLPHGVLFRGSSEGTIRKRLIDRNQIDAVIGLPSMLFTNTGIPVAVIILKKSRAITDPVLMIDASNNFIKVGKQNVLQEKDIAKIVDVYTSKEEVAGFSHLATLKEIVQNEYNMNIPRYVQSLDEDIAHDVDAHLFGGIPEANIKELKILHELVPDVLAESIEEIRPAYVGLKTSIKEMTDAVLKHERIISLSKDLELKITAYIAKYWNELKSVTADANLTDLEARMLLEIKQILKAFDHLDVYSAYQVIAEIWKNALTHDTELIAIEGFYTVARLREPNMVTKGTGKNKREEQDGWNGKIIPNDLIAQMLYSKEQQALENKRNNIQELEMELSDLVEAAKVEDSAEYDALFDSIKRDKEDEPTDSFDKTKLKAEVKSTDKKSDKYTLLKKVDRLIADSAKLTKELNSEVKALRDAVEERILVLTDEEIDSLLHYKWFGKTVNDMTSLIHTAVKRELNILQNLEARYADTLDSIDGQIESLLADFETLKNDLEVE
ncbi:type I restriction-modification system subunit M [Ancylomarina sp. 16SWW S1-10-2]|uniref:type I restriction-modification system subunit M n=1 Tax=Ancylomarina sp. 16SWW S1-10-2 TaxID=2499681 RepID=UPI0012AD2868|nr:type I restriction-modification system subunit M [Ancylomarina sp. 16SWW S1-10-2]MRT93009.1 type I restriction-modification system subunit M [Ancylomarina sp. 16SWW S1-10-2]